MIPKLSGIAQIRMVMFGIPGWSYSHSPQAFANCSGLGIICLSPNSCELATASRSKKRAPGRCFALYSSLPRRGELGICQLASNVTTFFPASTEAAADLSSLGVSRNGATILVDILRLKRYVDRAPGIREDIWRRRKAISKGKRLAC